MLSAALPSVQNTVDDIQQLRSELEDAIAAKETANLRSDHAKKRYQEQSKKLKQAEAAQAESSEELLQERAIQQELKCQLQTQLDGAQAQERTWLRKIAEDSEAKLLQDEQLQRQMQSSLEDALAAREAAIARADLAEALLEQEQSEWIQAQAPVAIELPCAENGHSQEQLQILLAESHEVQAAADLRAEEAEASLTSERQRLLESKTTVADLEEELARQEQVQEQLHEYSEDCLATEEALEARAELAETRLEEETANSLQAQAALAADKAQCIQNGASHQHLEIQLEAETSKALLAQAALEEEKAHRTQDGESHRQLQIALESQQQLQTALDGSLTDLRAAGARAEEAESKLAVETKNLQRIEGTLADLETRAEEAESKLIVQMQSLNHSGDQLCLNGAAEQQTAADLCAKENEAKLLTARNKLQEVDAVVADLALKLAREEHAHEVLRGYSEDCLAAQVALEARAEMAETQLVEETSEALQAKTALAEDKAQRMQNGECHQQLETQLESLAEAQSIQNRESHRQLQIALESQRELQAALDESLADLKAAGTRAEDAESKLVIESRSLHHMEGILAESETVSEEAESKLILQTQSLNHFKGSVQHLETELAQEELAQSRSHISFEERLAEQATAVARGEKEKLKKELAEGKRRVALSETALAEGRVQHMIEADRLQILLEETRKSKTSSHARAEEVQESLTVEVQRAEEFEANLMRERQRLNDFEKAAADAVMTLEDQQAAQTSAAAQAEIAEEQLVKEKARAQKAEASEMLEANARADEAEAQLVSELHAVQLLKERIASNAEREEQMRQRSHAALDKAHAAHTDTQREFEALVKKMRREEVAASSRAQEAEVALMAERIKLQQVEDALTAFSSAAIAPLSVKRG